MALRGSPCLSVPGPSPPCPRPWRLSVSVQAPPARAPSNSPSPPPDMRVPLTTEHPTHVTWDGESSGKNWLTLRNRKPFILSMFPVVPRINYVGSVSRGVGRSNLLGAVSRRRTRPLTSRAHTAPLNAPRAAVPTLARPCPALPRQLLTGSGAGAGAWVRDSAPRACPWPAWPTCSSLEGVCVLCLGASAWLLSPNCFLL